MPFLVLPFLTRELSQESMGYYILFQSIYSLILPFIGIGASAYVMVEYFQLPKNKYSETFFNSLITVALFFVLFSILVLPFNKIFVSTFNFPFRILLLILLLSFFNQINTLLLSQWRLEQKIQNYGVFSVLLTIIKNALGLGLIFIFDFDWDGVVWGLVIGNAIFALYSIIYLNQFVFREQRRIQLKYIKYAIEYGLPLSIHSLGSWLGNLSSRLIVDYQLGKTATASFGIATTFFMILNVLQDAFNKAYQPYLFKHLSTSPDKLKIVKITYAYYFGINILALCISLLGYYGVGYIFGDIYTNSRRYIFPVVFSSAFNGMYKMHVNFLFYQKETKLIPVITIASGIFNVVACFVFIPLMGILGAAYSMLFTQIIAYVMALIIAQKKYPMPWANFLK